MMSHYVYDPARWIQRSVQGQGNTGIARYNGLDTRSVLILLVFADATAGL